MNQEPPPDDGPVVFDVPLWNSESESWEDYLHAVERAYAQYRDRRRQGSAEHPPAQHPDPDEALQEPPRP